ncbi:MAG: YggS family pyridoxal phosphate-dependent enzyme [Kiritimatiellia bacterium]
MDNGFQERLEGIRRRMREACDRAGRDPSSVRLLPVSKTFGPDAVLRAAESGLDVFGENKVQEAQAKIPLCPGRLHWHLIGHLQSNKVRAAVRLFETVHSADSIGLLERLDAACAEEGRRLDVLLQVNVSGEATKHGLRPDEARAAAEFANALPNLVLRGFMTIPQAFSESEGVRPSFRRLRELRDGLRDSLGIPLEELSMGMSHDFETAIEEGATWIRVGSALFGARTRGGDV